MLYEFQRLINLEIYEKTVMFVLKWKYWGDKRFGLFSYKYYLQSLGRVEFRKKKLSEHKLKIATALDHVLLKYE
jgi:hypothetical protein